MNLISISHKTNNEMKKNGKKKENEKKYIQGNKICWI